MSHLLHRLHQPQPKHTPPPEPYLTRILLALIEAAKPNGGVWWDAGMLPRIRYEMCGDPTILTWTEAAQLAQVQVPGWPTIKKKATSELGIRRESKSA